MDTTRRIAARGSKAPGASGRRRLRRSGTLLFVLLTALSAAAERQVVRVENGITVEEERAAGRTLPILYGTTTMAAPVEQIYAWIRATETHADWMHNCAEARALGQQGEVLFAYNRIESPWPVSDRDVVLRSTRSELGGGAIRVDFRSTDEESVPEQSGVVRMPRLEGHYELRPAAGGTTHVEYRVDSDPGGSLPAWLVERASKELPFFTLANLRERAEAGLPGGR